jgi:predicted TIM-barrel fold metal-dependent hydrolase
MRIDAHAHLIPADYRGELERRSLLPYPLPRWEPELLDELMERHAIDAAIVSLSPPGVWFGDAPLAAELARMVNEATAAHVRRAPQRFAGLAVLPLPDVDATLTEIAYALDVLELDGLALMSNHDGIYHGDPRWDVVWDELQRRQAYVFLHPTMPLGAPALAHHPVWLYEFPFDTTRAIVNLIYSGTLERCPDVRLQVSHLGGTVPFLAHRIASLAEREPEKAAQAPGGALHALGRLYYDTGLSNHASAIRSTLEHVSAERILFGTDWPYAALPASGDPAPELEPFRPEIDAVNAAALVPRLAREVGRAA